METTFYMPPDLTVYLGFLAFILISLTAAKIYFILKNKKDSHINNEPDRTPLKEDRKDYYYITNLNNMTNNYTDLKNYKFFITQEKYNFKNILRISVKYDIRDGYLDNKSVDNILRLNEIAGCGVYSFGKNMISTETELMIAVEDTGSPDKFKKLIEKINRIIAEYKNTDFKERILTILKNQSFLVWSSVIHYYLKRIPIDDDIKNILNQLLDTENIDQIIFVSNYLKKESMDSLLALLRKRHNLAEDDTIKSILLFKNNLFLKSINTLQDIFLRTGSDEVKKCILDAFAYFKDIKLSGFLMSLLNEMSLLDKSDNKINIEIIKKLLNESDKSINLEIIKTLGTCGDLDAVEKLYILKKSSNDADLKNAVQKTISLIQSRYNGQKGTLSMIDISGTDGALSAAEQAQSGELSGAEEA